MNGPHEPIFLENPADNGIVVFIHGFMGSPRQFYKFAESVHKQGKSATTLLLPGHGGSAKDFSIGTMERWQRHVDSEIERLSRDYKDIRLVGHSMGGLLALNAAVKYDEVISGVLVMMSPFKLVAFSPTGMKARLKRVFVKKSHPMKAAPLLGNGVRHSPSLIWRVEKPFFELKKLMRTTKEILAEVRAPVMAIYTRSDELTSIKSLDILKAGLINAESFEQVILSDSMHAYYPEHERAIIGQTILKFAFE